ncbi:hypothetical protein BD324DRAFT_678900 [Kockovaella imperatae]|uniref:Uncharacterized protein n=1 Tax=Kockovaella imperatae TaxID=4999 RepID=A0A1Y1UQG5_9TREE|nr:hypothetical protein BD324DRAFT_678900 [Kockovaella imperatae]ORX39807.1 hypothetical protein BD324DRAFT_678900 [Kockovaella imperatae]
MPKTTHHNKPGSRKSGSATKPTFTKVTKAAREGAPAPAPNESTQEPTPEIPKDLFLQIIVAKLNTSKTCDWFELSKVVILPGLKSGKVVWAESETSLTPTNLRETPTCISDHAETKPPFKSQIAKRRASTLSVDDAIAPMKKTRKTTKAMVGLPDIPDTPDSICARFKRSSRKSISYREDLLTDDEFSGIEDDEEDPDGASGTGDSMDESVEQ